MKKRIAILGSTDSIGKCLIDLIKPISTIRNYTVTLPLVSIIIGNIFMIFINDSFKSFTNKIFFCTFLCFLMVLSINI